ncbi:hypothetical protein [Methylomonas sp. AM2-LC]|uniref:hypothetical protein n=1 Tax=Methylomonas sp. AM2-LC TaxID=3153301 RepID=UPI0032646892
MTESNMLPSDSEFLLYKSEDGSTCLDAKLSGETVWLSLLRESVVANFATTAADGKTVTVSHSGRQQEVSDAAI